MAKIKTRTFKCDLPADTDIKEIRWFFGPAGDAGFVPNIDAKVDTLSPTFKQLPTDATDGALETPPRPDVKVLRLKISENSGLAAGDWQAANVVMDVTGNFGDTFQDPSWVLVPLDLTAPGKCSNGSVD